MSLFATEKLPQPLAADGVVFNDVLSRTLFVRLPDTASGYTRLLWKQGWQLLRQNEESGWARASFVWAHGAGKREIAHVLPADGGQLKVHFPVARDSVYGNLISKPLAAIVTVDRGTHRILGVKFLNRGVT